MQPMKVEMVRVSKLTAYEFNPKAHPPEQVDMIARSIREFGFRVPLVVTAENEVVAGHGRLLAARDLGLDEVPCVRADDLTDDQVRAFRIADNRSAESDWIEDYLTREIKLLDENGYDIGWMDFDFEEAMEEIKGGQIKRGGERSEVEFSREMLLEHNYVVLYFDNPFDWQVAQEKFNLKTVKDLIPRKAQPRGVGRVLPGAEWLERIR